MLCPNCQTENPEDAKFCQKCGLQLLGKIFGGERRTSGKAVSSLVCGIGSVGCICFTGIPAIILGFLALRDIRRNPDRLTGEGMSIAGIVLGAVFTFLAIPFVGILLSIAMPNFLNAQIRAKVSTASTEMRNLAASLESYYIDSNQYPFAAGGETWDAVVAEPDGVSAGYTPSSLTSPISYLSSLPDDPFIGVEQIQDPGVPMSYAYRYATQPQQGWILVSNGPDQDVDIPAEDYVDPEKANCDIMKFLQQFGGEYVQYDPSNGTTSDGDIFRTGP